MKLFSIAAVLFVLTGCATQSIEPKTISIKEPFDPKAASEMIASGNAKLTGTAFMRQQGGGVVTCAGNAVNLIPATKYAMERMTGIYSGSFTKGEVKYLSVYHPHSKAVFQPDPSEYKRYTRTSICDAQGNFEFQDVKDGWYYLATRVVWTVRMVEGGGLATLISVQDGKSDRVIISK